MLRKAVAFYKAVDEDFRSAGLPKWMVPLLTIMFSIMFLLLAAMLIFD